MGRMPAILVVAVGHSAAAQVTFQVLPNLPGVDGCAAIGVSADGSVICGGCDVPVQPPNPPILRALRWTAAGMVALEPEPYASSAQVQAISADGLTVGGSTGGQAFRWDSPQIVTLLPSLNMGYAAEVSGNAAVLVGSVTVPFQGERAARWSGGALQPIDPLPGFSQGHAWGVSNDGTVVVGESVVPGAHAFRWTAATGAIDLGTLPGHTGSTAWGISGDGSVIVGSSSGTGGDRAFRWTAATGMEDLLPGLSAQARKASADGSVIIGFADPGPRRAVLWRHGVPAYFDEYLAAAGINPGGTIQWIADVSDDGRTLVGSITLAGGEQHGWVARIAGPCYPNCDASTTPPILNTLDFTCFLNRFAVGESWANCDGSTIRPVLNISDFTCFLNRFAAGCP
jgi:probable HAF family extracellular repeat protein